MTAARLLTRVRAGVAERCTHDGWIALDPAHELRADSTSFGAGAARTGVSSPDCPEPSRLWALSGEVSSPDPVALTGERRVLRRARLSDAQLDPVLVAALVGG